MFHTNFITNKRRRYQRMTQILPLDAFFAQPPRYPTPLNNVTIKELRHDYHTRTPINTIMSKLLTISCPTPEEEKLMRTRLMDINGYINDNIVTSVHKLSIAVSGTNYPILDRLREAMWDLYIDTLQHPFSDDSQCICLNYQRLEALETFRSTLTKHITALKNAPPKPCLGVFLDVLLIYACTIFESRPHRPPIGMDVPQDMTLWQLYLQIWNLPLYC